ncbi:MAG TPA: MBL fold metallo-hydrolase [Candidatus Limnocylindrales bacterium]
MLLGSVAAAGRTAPAARATGIDVTILGCGSAPPQPDTPASGLLVRSGDGTLLLDCGPGVIAALGRRLDPRRLDAVVISHLHADHFLDLVGLRYLFPWRGLPRPVVRVLLPPGGRDRIAALERAIGERPGFLGEALELVEFDPGSEVCVGGLALSFVAARHYVPSWGLRLQAADGTLLVYAGDTGPNPGLAAGARGAALLILEATLADPFEDDPVRGHLTAPEALAAACEASARRLLVTHFPSLRRPALEAWAAAASTPERPVLVARPGLRLRVREHLGGAPRRAG